MKNLRVALDSGAFSLYNTKFAHSKKGMESDKHLADYDYVKSKEFKAYLEGYIAFVHEHKDKLDFYITLDIIYNAKASLKVLKYIESCGLTPIPVFHHGEDFKYLKRYLDNYEYIGVGGLGQRTSVQKYIDFGDQIFKMVCDKHGQPTCKIHGFAMTSVQLMKRYPWYSSDSSTWTALSRNGWARFPRIHRDGTYDWLRKPISWRFTERSRHTPVHIDKQSELAKQFMAKYLAEMFGFTLDDMREGYFGRDVTNAGHTLLLGKALKEYYAQRWGYSEGANLYLAGHPGCGMSVAVIKREFTWARRPLGNDAEVCYLSSHFYNKETEIILKAMQRSKRRRLR